MSRTWIPLLLATCASANTAGETLDLNIDFGATIVQQVVHSIEPGRTQKVESVFQPRVEFDLSDSTRLTAIARLRIDTEGRLGFDGGHANRDIELRELYLDANLDGLIPNGYLRLGKQQVVWGQADGLRVLDAINPLDYREFILPEFEDYRIPLWMVNLELPLGDTWMAQILWIPDQTYDELPQTGSPFAFTSPLLLPSPPPGLPVTLARTDKPGRVVRDADTGLRLSAFLGGWDVSLNYLYHYRDQPALFRTVSATGVEVQPRYERSHLVGGSASNVFGDFIFRAELGLSTDRYVVSADPERLDGLARANELSYVIGLDYQGWRDWYISGQLFQSVLDERDDRLLRDRVDSAASLLIRRDFLNETVQSEVLLIENLNRGDGAIQAQLRYEWRSNLQLVVGADSFHGNRVGFFGQFRDLDRVFLRIEVGI